MKKNSPTVSPEAVEVPAIAGIRPAPRHVPAGKTLFRRGDKAIGIYFLASGKLRLHRVTPDGGEVTMHTARAGELFAEASLFADNYHCDATAETDCEAWLYPKDDLARYLHDDPASLWAFAAGLARSLQGIRQRYELKQIRSAPARVLQLLRLRCDDAGVYRITGSFKDMAAELGLTHEALYRALATLERDGRIVRSDRDLRVTATRATA